MTLPTDLMSIMWGGFKVLPAGPNQPVLISYSFTPPSGGTAMNGTQQAQVKAAIASIEKVASVHFNLVTSGTPLINFGMKATGNPATTLTLNNNTHAITHANVLMSTATYNANINKGAPFINPTDILRETMRAMADFNVLTAKNTSPGGFFYADDMTDMIANSTADTGRFTFSTGPQYYDIAQLQAIYGANISTNNANDTYDLKAINNANTRGFTIWDAGGNNDTLTAANLSPAQGSGSSFGSALDLNAGMKSFGVDGLSSTISVWIAEGANIENATGTFMDDIITGNALANRLLGGGGFDTMLGGAGNDFIDGGDGGDSMDGQGDIDTLDYALSNAGVAVNIGANTASGGWAQGDTLANFENLNGSGFNDTLIGTIGNNTLNGNAGADTIFGGAGADTINGGIGNDIIDGGSGADILDGGADSDTLDYTNSTGGVNINIATNVASGGWAQGEVIANFEHITGSASNDTLTGNAGNNTLKGGGGNDIINGGGGDDFIEGGAGGDTMDGGTGTDTLSYLSSAGFVQAVLGTGVARGNDGDADTIVNIENLTGTNFSDFLAGSAVANVIIGGSGDDTIEGREGGDTLEGGAGFDMLSYSLSSAAVQVNLAAGTATGGDAQGDSFTTFENLTGSAFNDSLTGDAGANTIDGGKGLNIIDGGGGADTLIGGTGTNNIHGGTGNDNINDSSSGGFIVLYGDDGDDFIVESGTAGGSLFGGTGNDILQNNSAVGAFMEGDDGADQITGGAGADLIWGGAGDDILSGGAGADTFYYSLLAWPGNNGNDTITGFQPGIDSFLLVDDLYFDGTVHSNGNTILSIFNDGALDGTITVLGVTI